jgi:hypothetical protein
MGRAGAEIVSEAKVAPRARRTVLPDSLFSAPRLAPGDRTRNHPSHIPLQIDHRAIGIEGLC